MPFTDGFLFISSDSRFTYEKYFSKRWYRIHCCSIIITISFYWIIKKEEWDNSKVEIKLLESILDDVEAIKTYNQERSEMFVLKMM